MVKIGITGQSGFIGSYLFNLISTKEWCECIPFNDDYFSDTKKLYGFVKKIDVLIHLAAVNRCEDEKALYATNINLVKKVIEAFEIEDVKPKVFFSSSIQEERNNLYGQSKREGRYLFEKWAEKHNAEFTGLVLPNVFGPFGKPFYNSFIATFCYQLNNQQQPIIDNDGLVKLMYVGSLCEYILDKIKYKERLEKCVYVPPDFEMKVSEILKKLEEYNDLYKKNGIIPKLTEQKEINLFTTFMTYVNLEEWFPRKYEKHSDDRGAFFEIIKTQSGGQISFSTTKPGVTRGNHYHSRKIERFSVLLGKAIIELRRIGTNKTVAFELDGAYPSYIDIPIWYTHNIKNMGTGDLYTMFYVNEFYNPDDTDTYFEEV